MMMFGGNFAPRGWALCNGQLLAIAQNTALFSILGTTYGGDGRTTFGLPDMRGRAPVHEGRGPGLTDRRLGERGGSQENFLSFAQIPAHNHGLSTGTASIPVSTEDADQDEANGKYLANGTFYHGAPGGSYGGGPINLSGTTQNTGNSTGVNNIQPFTVVNYIIALQGTFPSRN